MFDDNFTGPHIVEFTNNRELQINIKHNIKNHLAHPLYLEGMSGKLYNWQNIISIRKVS